MTDRILHAVGCLAAFVALGVLLSSDRRAIRWRTITAALAIQTGIGALVLFWPPGRAALRAASRLIATVLAYGDEGTSFLFGALVGPRMTDVFGPGGFVVALRVLPPIVYVSALIAVLYHVGAMQALARGLGAALRAVLGTSRIESFAAVATVVVGQSEIALAIRPFMAALTGAELFAVMTAGMASTAGSILAGYVALGAPVEYLLAASVMAVPGGLLYAKLLVPSTEPSRVVSTRAEFGERRAANLFEAVAEGTARGLVIAVAIGATLISFVSLIALANGLLGWLGGLLGHPEVRMETALGLAAEPLAWLLGAPDAHRALVARALADKLVFNEFLAYARLSPTFSAGTLDPRTLAIVTFALCGFANLASIGVQLAAFSAVVPGRRSEVARFGLRAVLAGTLSNLTSAAVAGLFVA